MAKSTLTPTEFIQNSFSPFIAVLSSPLVDEICQQNNLSFIELLEPFCTSSKEGKDVNLSLVFAQSLQQPYNFILLQYATKNHLATSLV